jgi:hypothetical protein
VAWGNLLRRLKAAPALAAACAALFSASAAAAAEWRRAESEHFILYGELSEKEIVEHARKLEEFDGVLRRFLTIPGERPAETKLPVYLVRSVAEIRRIAPGMPKEVAGFYSAGRTDIYAVALLGSGSAGSQTLLHEYVHHFVLQNHARGFPAWLMEGVAEFFMTADFQRDRILVGMPNEGRAYVLANQAWLRMARLLEKRPERDSNVVGQYYALAWALTHYMMTDDTRRRQLNVYLHATSRGEPPLETWTRVTGEAPGVTTQKLERYFRNSLRGFSMTRDPATAQTPVAVTTLSVSADDLLLYDQGVKTNIGPDDQRRYVETIRQLAAKHPGDHLARLALGRVELRYGDAAAGEALLQDLLRQNPNDEEALQALALGKLDAAEKAGADRRALHAEAAALISRAFKVDANDYRTLYAYAQSQSSRPGFPSQNVINVLDKAVSLAPQVAEIRMAAARAMMAKKLWTEAAFMLEPVAASAHGGRVAQAAQEMLKQIPEPAGQPAPAADAGAN